jgi:hypothetical protein
MSKSKKETTELTTELNERPAFLADVAVEGLDQINEIVSPPALVIVQAMSQKLLDAEFEAGDVVMMPAQEKVSDTLEVTPIFFFSEYVCLNPREVNDLPMIREATFDSRSEIAQKCRDLVEFPCPENDKYMCRYQTNLVFLVYVEQLDQIVTLRFYRSEFKTGTLFASKIKARGASIYAGRYVLQVGVHKNDKGRWFGFDFKPTDQPWVTDEATFNRYADYHREFADLHARNLLRPDDGDVAEDDVEGEVDF